MSGPYRSLPEGFSQPLRARSSWWQRLLCRLDAHEVEFWSSKTGLWITLPDGCALAGKAGPRHHAVAIGVKVRCRSCGASSREDVYGLSRGHVELLRGAGDLSAMEVRWW